MKRVSILAFIMLAGFLIFGAPFTTPIIDGNMADWNSDEVRGSNDYNPWGESDLKSVWITWDADNLYVGMVATCVNNKLTLYLDVDPGAGTGINDFTNSDQYSWQGNNLKTGTELTEFGVDFTCETEGSGFHQVWKYDASQNKFNEVTTSCQVVWNGDGTSTTGYEAAIPWSVLYPNGFPTGAKIRLMANLHNNQDSGYWASDDIIPDSNRTNGTYDSSNGAWTSVPDYIEIVIDADNDGQPDGASTNDDFPAIVGAMGGGSVLNLSFNIEVGNGAADPTKYELFDANDTSLGNPSTATIDGNDAKIVHLSFSSEVMTAGNNYKIVYTDIPPATGSNNGSGTYEFIAGIKQDVTITFNLDTTPDLDANAPYSIRGSLPPLDWNNDTIMNSTGQAAHYTVDVTFPLGTNPHLEYKYLGTQNGTWESIPNRVLIIDDSSSTMVVNDVWNNVLSQDVDVIFHLDMGNYLCGTIQVRGNVSPLSWGDDAPQMYDDGNAEHGDDVAGDKIYSAKLTFTSGSPGGFEYKFTDTYDDNGNATTAWDPTGPNLTYVIDTNGENIINYTWQNTAVPIPTPVDNAVWTLYQ